MSYSTAEKNKDITKARLDSVSAMHILRCACQEHNAKCFPACGSCKGSGCTNPDIFILMKKLMNFGLKTNSMCNSNCINLTRCFSHSLGLHT